MSDVANERPHLSLRVNETFTDNDFNAAKDALQGSFVVHGQQVVEFAEAPPPHVFVDLTDAINVILLAVAAHGLYDTLYKGLLHLLHPRTGARSLFVFTVRSGPDVVHGRLETSDPKALHQTIDSLGSLARKNTGAYEFNESTRRWRKQAPPMLGEKKLAPPKRKIHVEPE